MHEKYQSQGLLTLAISLHRKPEHARRQTSKLGVTFPVANGFGSKLDRDYGYA
jgi:hypothetical protein